MNVSLPIVFQADLLLCWFCTSHQEQKDTRYKISHLLKEPQVKQHKAIFREFCILSKENIKNKIVCSSSSRL